MSAACIRAGPAVAHNHVGTPGATVRSLPLLWRTPPRGRVEVIMGPNSSTTTRGGTGRASALGSAQLASPGFLGMAPSEIAARLIAQRLSFAPDTGWVRAAGPLADARGTR